MKLSDWDVVVVNTSGGKDSQAMMDYLFELAEAEGVTDRLHALHCDLTEMEWPGTRELAEEQSDHYGIPFHVMTRPQGNLLEQVRKRGMWPSNTARYCTSDHKRGQADKVIRSLAREVEQREGRPARVLSCMGLRAEESPARAKKPESWVDKRLGTKKGREVVVWLPIRDWTVNQVWDRIKKSGVRHHPAYDLGMPRLSCVFCIFAPRDALILAGQHNPELLDRYVEVEKEIGHTFRKNLPIADIQTAIQNGEQPKAMTGDWNM